VCADMFVAPRDADERLPGDLVDKGPAPPSRGSKCPSGAESRLGVRNDQGIGTRGSRAHHVSIWPERDVPILLATGQAEPSGTVPLGPTPALSRSRQA
jgi:hypothetical protein